MPLVKHPEYTFLRNARVPALQDKDATNRYSLANYYHASKYEDPVESDIKSGSPINVKFIKHLTANSLEFTSDTPYKGSFEHAITAPRTWTFPNASGTVALTASIATGILDVFHYGASADATAGGFASLRPWDRGDAIALAMPAVLAQIPMPTSGTLKGLAVEITSAFGATTSIAYHVFIDGVDTGISTIIGGGTTSSKNDAASYVVSTFDDIEIAAVATAGVGGSVITRASLKLLE